MEQFDVLVMGGGPGGYLAAERAAQAGLSVALIEKRALGGTCLNEGCVPTKSLLYCAKQYGAAAVHGKAYGVHTENVVFSHEEAVARKNLVVKRLVRGVGSTMKLHHVAVYTAEGQLLGKNAAGLFEVRAGDAQLSAKHLILATGSTAAVPPIEGVQAGLASGFVMTNREILDLTQPPKTLCCIGGGVIGLEMACYFAAIGVKVVVVEMLPKIAGNTDAEICDLLMKTYKKQGMEFHLSAGVREIRENAVVYADADGVHEVACDRVLLATGRRAMTQGFGLETLGVRTERGAIVTDEHMQTNVPGVYAVGDCNGRLMLAHAAYRQAEVAVYHICGVSDSVSESVVPSVIYTTPEVACAGLNEDEARATGHNIRVARVPMLYSGRFVAENDRGDGFCKLVYDADEDRLAGVQLIGPYASEMIYGAAMMVQLRLPLEQLKKIVFPHPTVAEVIREGLFML